MGSDIKKILVFGSNSFTGSNFISHVLEKTDAKIIGVSRSEEYDEIFLPYLYKKQKPRNFKFYLPTSGFSIFFQKGCCSENHKE